MVYAAIMPKHMAALVCTCVPSLSASHGVLIRTPEHTCATNWYQFAIVRHSPTAEEPGLQYCSGLTAENCRNVVRLSFHGACSH